MSGEASGGGGAFDDVDFAQVFADTPLAGEFDEESTPAESVGGYLGRSVGAWAGGVLGAAVLEPMLSDSGEADSDSDSDSGETDTDDAESDDAGDDADGDADADEGGEES